MCQFVNYKKLPHTHQPAQQLSCSIILQHNSSLIHTNMHYRFGTAHSTAFCLQDNPYLPCSTLIKLQLFTAPFACKTIHIFPMLTSKIVKCYNITHSLCTSTYTTYSVYCFIHSLLHVRKLSCPPSNKHKKWLAKWHKDIGMV